MLRLVETDFSSTGKPDLAHRTPPGFFHVRATNALLSKSGYLGVEIVTHEKEFMPTILIGGMNGHFCRRQRKDQPSVASIHRWKSEHVPKEGAISRRIPAVDDHVRTKDHELAPVAG